MKRLRTLQRIALWKSVGFVTLLGGLSVYGAFIGTKHAKLFFNCLPLVVFWVLLTLLLISGFLLFKRLRNSLGLLFAHLGPILILLGAMFASRIGYDFAKQYLGERRIEAGQMQIRETPPGAPLEAVNTVWDLEGKKIAGRLPFALVLKKFTISYHDADKPWRLGINAPPEGDNHERRTAEIEWKQGEDVEIPLIGGTIKVLRYVGSARVARGEAKQFKLEVTDADGNKTLVAAKVGQTVEVNNPKGTLKIVEVFTHLVTQKHKGQYHSVNVIGSYENPALRLQFTAADGKQSQTWAFRREAGFTHGVANLKTVYIVPAPRVVDDPTTELAAMLVLVARNGRQERIWLIGKRNETSISFRLPSAVGAAPTPATEAHKGHRHDPMTYLVMIRPSGMPRQDYSDLAILEEGKIVAEKKIWVNNPLHYGGYHFYQGGHGLDYNRPYTTLQVKYDAGLWPVYTGFFLLCAGPFWLFWFKPAWNHLKKRQAHGI